MKCTKLQERLAEDGIKVVDDPVLQAHVQACQSCQAVQKRMEQLEASLALLPEVKPSRELVARTLELVEQKRTQTRRFPYRWVLAAGAPVVLFLVLAGFWMQKNASAPMDVTSGSVDQPPGVMLFKTTTGHRSAVMAKNGDMEKNNNELANTEDDDGAGRFANIKGQGTGAGGLGVRGLLSSDAGGVDKLQNLDLIPDRFAKIDDMSNKNSLAKQTRIVPVFEDGKPAGMKVFGSSLERFGVKSGDVLRSIDGQALSSPDKALEVYSRFRAAQNEHELEITRDGRQLKLALPKDALTWDGSGEASLVGNQGLESLQYLPATGYFSNTYLPDDPMLDWLRKRLGQEMTWQGQKLEPESGSVPYQQPFDPPTSEGLAVFLSADHKAVEGPHRITLQVGIKGSLQHARRRASLHAALVVDLRQVPVEATRHALWTLAEAMAGDRQPGDRFVLVVAGCEEPVLVKPEKFTASEVVRALAMALEKREAMGSKGTLESALEAAYAALKKEANGDVTLGASMVLLATPALAQEEVETLSGQAHRRAVEGISLSAMGVGAGDGASGLNEEGLRQLAFSGQGRLRLVSSSQGAATAIESELAASGRVVARAVRLRIRLAKGVRLVEVLGSHPLTAVAADKVREAERAVDQQVSKNLGIQADRGEDEDGIQIVIPAFYAGDAHVILLDVVVPGAGQVADARVRYKDLVNLRNAAVQSSFKLLPGQAAADLLNQNVRKNLLAYQLSVGFVQAAKQLEAGAMDEAATSLRSADSLIAREIEQAPGLGHDSEVMRDRAMLQAYLGLLQRAPQWQTDSLVRSRLVFSLAYAGRMKLRPGNIR